MTRYLKLAAAAVTGYAATSVAALANSDAFCAANFPSTPIWNQNLQQCVSATAVPEINAAAGVAAVAALAAIVLLIRERVKTA